MLLCNHVFRPTNFVNFFAMFSTDSKSALNSFFLATHVENLANNFFLSHICTFCKLRSAMRTRNGSKQRKTYFNNVSYNYMRHPFFGMGGSDLSEKERLAVT